VTTAARERLPQPLAVVAPVSIDYAAMSLVVQRPESAGGYERLLWREAHQALVKAEESGWRSATPVVYAKGPDNRDLVHVVSGPNLTLVVAFMVGTPTAKVYAELVSKPGLSAFVTADKSTRLFMGVKFRHGSAG
jgi:hypothetical protein